MEVHPEFRAIFTVQSGRVCRHAQDPGRADGSGDHHQPGPLRPRDRSPHHMAKSGSRGRTRRPLWTSCAECAHVGVNNHRPTIRACIAIARVLAHRGGRARREDRTFRQICRDVLHTDTAKVTRPADRSCRRWWIRFLSRRWAHPAPRPLSASSAKRRDGTAADAATAAGRANGEGLRQGAAR